MTGVVLGRGERDMREVTNGETMTLRLSSRLYRGLRLTAKFTGQGSAEFTRAAIREKLERELASPLLEPDNRQAVLFEMARTEADAARLNAASRLDVKGAVQ